MMATSIGSHMASSRARIFFFDFDFLFSLGEESPPFLCREPHGHGLCQMHTDCLYTEMAFPLCHQSAWVDSRSSTLCAEVPLLRTGPSYPVEANNCDSCKTWFYLEQNNSHLYLFSSDGSDRISQFQEVWTLVASEPRLEAAGSGLPAPEWRSR